MAQTPAIRIQSTGDMIDYTPGSAVLAGAVVNVGTIPMIATSPIAANALGALAASGVFKVPQVGEAFAAGDDVYWDATGDPYGGTPGSGCAKSTASAYLLGTAVAVTASTDTYVVVSLTGIRRVSIISGALTASGIAAEDLSLAIAGLPGTAGVSSGVGGAIPITGGAGDSGIGGAVSLTGGAGSAAAGGAASVAGGAGGAASVGGAASLTGGAPASGNAIGGAATVTGGRGSGTQVGGAASLVAGAGGSGAGSGAGGAVAVTGGAGGATSGDGGAAVVAGGAGTAGNGNGGAASLLGGNAHGSGTDGAVSVGTSNTSAVNLAAASIPTTIGGPITASVGASTAAAGSTYADAQALPAGTASVYPTTAANDDKGVIVDAADKITGRMLLIGNGVANKILKVYGPSGAVINGAAANAGFSSASGKGVIMLCLSSTGNTWLAW